MVTQSFVLSGVLSIVLSFLFIGVGMALETLSKPTDAARTAKLQARELVRDELSGAGWPIVCYGTFELKHPETGVSLGRVDVIGNATVSTKDGRIMYNMIATLPVENYKDGTKVTGRVNANMLLPFVSADAKTAMAHAKALQAEQAAKGINPAARATKG